MDPGKRDTAKTDAKQVVDGQRTDHCIGDDKERGLLLKLLTFVFLAMKTSGTSTDWSIPHSVRSISKGGS